MLNLRVSGKLWNRSLIMSDVETNTEWSHLLGKAMAGPLKGMQLERIPSDMTTWSAWKKDHPETLVLDMSRTQKAYTSQFYKRPERFVLGIVMYGAPSHVSYASLKEKPIRNVKLNAAPFVVTFTESSTSARVFSRKLGNKVLNFEPLPARTDNGKGNVYAAAIEAELMRDKETGSDWTRSTGKAVSGKLKGKQLQHEVGIPSFTRAWKIFHPDSKVAE